MRTLGLICARAGSEGLPGKNLLELDGRKLIEWAILAAQESGVCDEVAVSTDIEPWRFDQHGATYMRRPDVLCASDLSKWPAYRHALQWPAYRHRHALRWGAFDAIVDIDVTRPLRSPEDIARCVRYLEQEQSLDVCMAVGRTDKHPSFDILSGKSTYLVGPLDLWSPERYTARQQLPAAWLHAGAYAITADAVRNRPGFWSCNVWGVEVDRAASYDIDDAIDWTVVQALWREYGWARTRLEVAA